MIKQNSAKWHNLKKSRIGSSEIFTLVSYYNTQEQLQNAGVDIDKFKDSAYITAYQLYHKLKNPKLYNEPLFCDKLSQFGSRIEDYVFNLVQKKSALATYKRGRVIYNKDGGNDIKIASIDIEGKANSRQIIEDCNGNKISLVDSPNFIVECKGMSNFKAFHKDIANIGVDYQYIFQLQYQLYCSGFDWGKIFVVSLDSDSEWTRSAIVHMPKAKAFKYLDKNSKHYEFIYKARPEYFFLIKNALERFQFDLRAGVEPELPNWEKAFKGNYKLFYNLVQQKALLLGGDDKVIKSNKFDSYFSLKDQEKKVASKLSNLGQDIRSLMLAIGKPCIEGKKGKIVMQSNFIKGYINKEND